MIAPSRDWLALDNSGSLYPTIQSPRTTGVFRLAVTLTEDLDLPKLKSAIEQALERLPVFRTRLRTGLFWRFLEENAKEPLVQAERADPCRKPMRDDRGYLWRVLVFRKRISLECSHALTDGTGAMAFLRAVLAFYLTEPALSVVDLNALPSGEESEDAYQRYFREGLPLARKHERAYHTGERWGKAERYRVVSGFAAVDELLELSRAAEVSLTEYLGAVMLDALQAHQAERGIAPRPIRLMIPVNLRRHLPSGTLRNFFVPIFPEIDPRLGPYRFEDILHAVHHDMRRMNEPKGIQRQIARNITTSRNPLVRFTPQFVKRLGGPVFYHRSASLQHSGVLTNLGELALPASVVDRVERFEFLPNPQPAVVTSLGLVSCKGVLSMGFGSVADRPELPGLFFLRLRERGVALRVETNETPSALGAE